MKKVIVTTTINPPTEAIRHFDSMSDWDLVVIGDLKTPTDYKLKRGSYYGPEEQEKYDKALSDAIGWNCIQRRNIGTLIARDMNADVVAMIDDDNIPTPDWGKDVAVGRELEVNYYETELPVFDPIGATNYPWLWHRGFPLQLLPQRDYRRKRRLRLKIDVQADFWDGDPDIDAICRMEHAPECKFDPDYFPFAANKFAPFDSQNTFLSRVILKDYFLFPHIGRMDDIWAAYYVQAKGYRVAFAKASVFQRRNPHDLVRDMRQEYLGYENNLDIVRDLARDAKSIAAYLPGRAIWAWSLYLRHFDRA
jgi:hypothetical protein